MSALLEVEDIKTYFIVRQAGKRRIVKAVDGVSFSINRGETLGMVGESGCGKSTVGRTIMRFNKPEGGRIIFDGNDITTGDMRPYRSRMQMVFQDPYSSLDPRMSIGEIVAEPLNIQYPAGQMSKQERADIVLEKMRLVGMNQEALSRFPHEFSGGQRQRISIARAMVTKLDLLILDEPVSALDVSIQAQIINMLMDLQERFGMAYLFIAHDLSVVRHISQRVMVMYLGRCMESAGTEALHKNPLHPYTQALLSAIPVPDPEMSRKKRRVVLEGDVPSPVDPPSGCVFRTRCHYAAERCAAEAPVMEDAGQGHFVACHNFRRL
ncbi:MAG: ATP-binding cassette domain-containing protein [Clostridiales bacterium]|jgi:oligopeptide transport system ATP-binding protein|nr:ATP-binding cassette domain-containing protein [Clostridiales bacterium]